MSSGDAAKLETFLIVAYTPLRHNRSVVGSMMSTPKVQSMIKNFQISDKEPLFGPDVASDYRTYITLYGKDPQLALISLSNYHVYIPDQPEPVNLKGSESNLQSMMSGCDTGFFWKEHLLIGLAQNFFAVWDCLNQKLLYKSTCALLFKVGTYSGHSFYSCYGRGSKLVNDCIVMSSEGKRVVMVPLSQFVGHADSFIEVKSLKIATFETAEPVIEIDMLEPFVNRKQISRSLTSLPGGYDQVAWISPKGHLSIIKVQMNSLKRSLDQELLPEDSANPNIRKIKTRHAYLLERCNVYQKIESCCPTGRSRV